MSFSRHVYPSDLVMHSYILRCMSRFSFCTPSDPKLEAHKLQLSSGVASDLFPGLEGLGVELGAYGKVRVNWSVIAHCLSVLSVRKRLFPHQTVSYAQFLFPTNALVRPKSSGALEPSTTQTPLSRYQCNGQKNYTTPSRLNSTIGQDLSTLRFTRIQVTCTLSLENCFCNYYCLLI